MRGAFRTDDDGYVVALVDADGEREQTPLSYGGNMRACAVSLLMILAGCSGGAPKETKAAPVTPPPDESRRLPSKDQLSTRVVAEHLLDQSIAPGGTVGEYKDARGSYQ